MYVRYIDITREIVVEFEAGAKIGGKLAFVICQRNSACNCCVPSLKPRVAHVLRSEL